MFIKGKSFGGGGDEKSSSVHGGESPRKANGGEQGMRGSKSNDTASREQQQEQKPEKRRKSIIRSLRNSLIAMTGGTPREDASTTTSSSSDMKKRLAAKKASDDRRSRELQHDFVNFPDIEERRQAQLEEDENYYKLTDIVFKSEEEMKKTRRTVKYQLTHIHDHGQRLKHVTDRLDANDEVTGAFENLLMMMVKQLEASGKWTEELQEHIESIENAKRRRGSITEYVSEIDTNEGGDSTSMPNTPRDLAVESSFDTASDMDPGSVTGMSRVPRGAYSKMLKRMMSFESASISLGSELAYADFVPKFLTGTSVEPFDTILARVKQWIQSCENNVKILNIETVIVPLDAIREATDTSTVGAQSSSASSGNLLAECVRVWIDARAGYPHDWPGRTINSLIYLRK